MGELSQQQLTELGDLIRQTCQSKDFPAEALRAAVKHEASVEIPPARIEWILRGGKPNRDEGLALIVTAKEIFPEEVTKPEWEPLLHQG